jgi:rod shape-determining protein MreC
MAPPSPRRPGFSKRAQLSLFATYVIAVAGMLLGALLLVTAYVDPKGNSALRSFLDDIFSPLSRTGRAVIMTVSDGTESVSAYWDAAAKNEAMSAELKAAREKLIQGQRDAMEVARLKRLAKLVEASDGEIVSARLVSSTGTSSRRYALLAAGASDGVAQGQVVLSPEGLVGRVATVGRHSARVLLIIDNENRVPVKRVPDGAPALAIGVGDGRMELQTLTAGANPFKVGDVFVTSGTGGLYRPGIPVAIATRQSRDKTVAVPLAHPARFDFAIVEQPMILILPPDPAAPGAK